MSAGLRLLLASESPRRRELLAAAGIPFRPVPSRGRESVDPNDPFMTVEANARAKAEGAVIPSDEAPPLLVLGADTVVVCGGSILGKPTDREEAGDMIRRLAGGRHTVVSGVAVRRLAAHGDRSAEIVAGCAETDVWFRELTDPQIQAYLDTGEWRDKAGAYGIQGRAGLFVERIEGEYFAVVGLSLRLLVSLLAQLGLDALSTPAADVVAQGGHSTL